MCALIVHAPLPFSMSQQAKCSYVPLLSCFENIGRGGEGGEWKYGVFQ